MKSTVLCILAWLSLGATTWGAEKHIRVIFDTSKTMVENDRPRLASLAAQLLFDLARPNPALGDSFKVYTFHPTEKWNGPSFPPPTSIGSTIDVTDRSSFQEALRRQPYNGRWTYFYPGLLTAVQDLEGNGAADAIRMIIVVTDGFPVQLTRDAELQLIRNSLTPRLAAAGIQVYVLAFGPQAGQDVEFFRQIVGTGSTSLGDVFVDVTGERLLDHMAEIFSRGFGYSGQPLGRYPRVRELDLSGGETPARVAVLLYWRKPEPARISLSAPGAEVNAPDGVQDGREAGSSYSLIWVLSPSPGLYELQSDGEGCRVLVLRPSDFNLSIVPRVPAGVTDLAIAGQALPLTVLVRPAANVPGSVGNVTLSFQTHGPRTYSSHDRRFDYRWTSDRQGPAGVDLGNRGGPSYAINPVFPEPSPEEDFYVGYVSVDARRGHSVVASLTGASAHPVEVYPYLRLAPHPARAEALTRTLAGGQRRPLGKRETGCAQFELVLEAGRLPHASHPMYSLRATLPASFLAEGALNEAEVTLDGLPLRREGDPVDRLGWSAGRELSGDELLGTHEVCLQTGRPRGGDNERPLTLQVLLRLNEEPYYQFDTIGPLALLVRIAPPDWFERLLLLAPLWLFPLALVGLWYARFRPNFPADFQVSAGADPVDLAPCAHSQYGLLRRLLGLSPRLEVSFHGRPLGWIRPTRQDLYSFRPSGTAILRAQGEAKSLESGRVYEVVEGESSYYFRVEYHR